MDEHLRAFLDNLSAERGLATNTLAAYEADLVPFCLFADKRGKSLSTVTADDAIAFFESLERRGFASATLARKGSALRMLAHYLVQEEVNPTDFTAALELGVVKQVRLPSTLSIAEIEKLITAPPIDTPEGTRDRAMFELMYACGLRVSEIVDLEIGQIDLTARFVRPMGKGSKERVVPIGDVAHRLLTAYLK
jgi:integrase/recombinase XerD